MDILIPNRKVVVLSTGDVHGAYEYAYRIVKFLREKGCEAILLVLNKTKADSFIVGLNIPQKSIGKRLQNRFFTKKNISFSTNSKYLFFNNNEKNKLISAEEIIRQIPFVPDIIVSGMTIGFVNSDTLVELKKMTGAKMYSIMVDMSPITGGCHYAWECTGYENECKNCPAINDQNRKHIASDNLAIKIDNYRKIDLNVIGGSEWTIDQAKKSTLFKNQKKYLNLNSCIDTNLFHGRNRSIAKKVFGIEKDQKIIFTGAWSTKDERKGIIYFVESLHILWNSLNDSERSNISIMVAGENNRTNDLLSAVPFKIHLIDYISDYRLLSLAYQAADIFVCSSIEDSGPMMVSEALASGTPVVAFKMGIADSMVKNNYNGYLANLCDSKDLAKGLLSILTLSKEQFEAYSSNAINQIKFFSSQDQVVEIFNEIMAEI